MQTVEEALSALSTNARNAEAWEIIASDVYKPLLAYVASLLLTFRVAAGETAHDIVQQVLLTFYEHLTKSSLDIKSAKALHSYLRTSCRNLLIDKYRHQRHAEQFVDFLALKFSKAFQDESSLYKTIFLDEIIQKLPPDCGSLFRQYVSEDLSPAEIADRVGASPATFYSRWYRCIQKAKEVFLKRKGEVKRL
jgi:RNA polymerase sigma factor (sigma-70 family)